MKLDASKAHLTEKDIEDYLYENPQDVEFGDGRTVSRWIKRQYQVPSGIIDLLGVTGSQELVVVEVKNVPVDASALTQVSRYAYDIENIISGPLLESLNEGAPWPDILKVVIGRSVEGKTFREAEALGIHILAFEVELYLQVSNRLTWPKDFIESRNQQYLALAEDEELTSVINGYNANYLEWKEWHANHQESDVLEQVDEVVQQVDSHE